MITALFTWPVQGRSDLLKTAVNRLGDSLRVYTCVLDISAIKNDFYKLLAIKALQVAAAAVRCSFNNFAFFFSIIQP